jgi:hypothetical protein
MSTVAGLFNTEEEAQHAVEHLKDSGIDAHDIGVMARAEERARTLSEERDLDTSIAAASGAIAGGVLGGGLGLLLAAIGAVAVPVVGPVVAAGPLVMALTGAGVGALTGGLVGALTAAGIPEEEATIYQTGIERGGILVTAHVPSSQEASARAIFRQYGSVEPTYAQQLFSRDPDYRMGQGKRGGAGEALGGGAGAIAGGVFGAAVGGPVGAVVGAAIGGAAGAGAGHIAQDDEGSQVGPQAGGASGAVLGGAIGSVGGPVGAALGAIAGGAVGAYTGEKASEAGAEAVGTTQTPSQVDAKVAPENPNDRNNVMVRNRTEQEDIPVTDEESQTIKSAEMNRDRQNMGL